MTDQKPLIQNKVFEVYEIVNRAWVEKGVPHKVFHFSIHDIQHADQSHIHLLTKCLEKVTQQKDFKCSIVLDTLRVKAMGVMKALIDLDVERLRKLEKNNLMKFVMTTSNKMVKQVCNAAIKMRGASSYARVFSTLSEALQFIAKP
jgi:hypothetical protein